MDVGGYMGTLEVFLEGMDERIYGDEILRSILLKDWREVRRDIEDFIKNYRQRVEEASRLRIGIVGQIKAGKSSFLNCILFDCEDILPKAPTPTTASLNYITYSENPRIEVEFFTKEDITEMDRNLERISKSRDETLRREAKNIKKIIETAAKNREIIEKGRIEIPFQNLREINRVLGDYVSAKGKYSLLVKALYLYINHPAVRYVDIVDTPGLNDPVTSRSERTRDFIEKADIILLLSSASQFLEEADARLLAQIYRRRSAKVWIVASKFDGVLLDAISGFGKGIRKKDFGKLFNEEKEKRLRNVEDFRRKYISDGESGIIISDELFTFSVPFRKLELGKPLSRDEERIVNKLKDRTTGFRPISGFDEVKEFLREYEDKKRADAERSEIVKRYLKERPASVLQSIESFGISIREKRERKDEDLKREIEEKERQKRSLEENMKEIKGKLMDLYEGYIEQLERNLLYTIEERKQELIYSLESAKDAAWDTKVETVYRRVPRKGFFWGLVRIFTLGIAGYDEIPVRVEYEYYDRDYILSIIRAEVDRMYDAMDLAIDSIFNMGEIRSKILNILSNYELPSSITQRVVGMKVHKPSVRRDEDFVNRIFGKLKRYSREIRPSSIESFMESAKEAMEEIMDNIKNMAEGAVNEVRDQLEKNISDLLSAIEEHISREIEVINIFLNTSKEEREKIRSMLESMEREIDRFVEEARRYIA